MAREFDVKVKGLAEVDRLLAGIPAAAGRRVQVAALKMAARPIAAEAEAIVVRRTGVLAASIKTAVKRGATAARATVRVGLEAPGRWYAHLVEFGTRQHGNHPGTSPQPFMAPAFERMKERAIQIYATEARAAIERHLKRAAKKGRRA